MKAYLACSVYCPECGEEMVRPKNKKHIRCMSVGCELYNVSFNAPSVEIEEKTNCFDTHRKSLNRFVGR